MSKKGKFNKPKCKACEKRKSFKVGSGKKHSHKKKSTHIKDFTSFNNITCAGSTGEIRKVDVLEPLP